MGYSSGLEGQEGQEGQEGYSASGLFPGYIKGGRSPASTLLPGVDPATAVALIKTREALHRPSERIEWSPPRASAGLPDLRCADRLAQWSLEIRSISFMTELMGPLRISANNDEASYTVNHRPGENAETTDDEIPVVTIVRPLPRVFEDQVQMVVDYAALRSERLQEIVTEIGIPVQYWAAIMDLNPTTTPYTLELLALGYAFASAITQPCKHTLGAPRPENYSPSVQPVINPRRFGAFPSGHATEAFLTARLLQLVSRQHRFACDGKESKLEQQLQRLAMRIAVNRTVAGVHFPVDSTAGRMLGETLATYLAYRCGNPDSCEGWVPRVFEGQIDRDGNPIKTWTGDFDRHDELDKWTDSVPFFWRNDGTKSGAQKKWTVVKGGESLLDWLWTKAQQEWIDPPQPCMR